MKSHDIVKAMRPELQRISERWGAKIKLAEVPSGPPVLQTLVAEIFRNVRSIRRITPYKTFDQMARSPCLER